MAENKNLTISIITPSFNRAQYIEQTILSIKNQDYPFIEHIIVDGGSTDGTLEILKKHEGTYNLTWISEKDNGCADAMEKGFKMATGDIFCWLDSDDAYLPGTIKKVMDIFKRNQQIGVVYGDVFISNQDGKIIDAWKCIDFDREVMAYVGPIFGSQATFWKRELHKKLGGLDKKYQRAADYDFFMRMGLSGAKFYYIKEFLSIYRRHPDQLTKSLELCKLENDEIFKKYIDKNLTLSQLNWRKRKAFAKRIFYFIKQGDLWHISKHALKRFGISPKTN